PGGSVLPPDVLREHFNVRGCNDERDRVSRTRRPDYQSTPRRGDVLKRLADLEPRLAKGDLSTFERIDLGACYLRLGRYPQAKKHLEDTKKRVSRDDPARFLVLLDLAAAWFYDVEPDPRKRNNQLRDRDLFQAINYQQEALRSWPPSWGRDIWLWYR